MLKFNFWHQKEKELGAQMKRTFLPCMGIHIIYLRQIIVESEFIVNTNKTREKKKGKTYLVKRESTRPCLHY